MSEFTSLKQKKQWENYLKIFGNSENGRQMARLVMRASNGEITEEERQAYIRQKEEDLAAIKEELEYGCIPAIDHIITPEENERLKRELIEKEKPQLFELEQEAVDAGIPLTEHLRKEIQNLYDA
jgi:hypothetical protein